MAQSLAVTPLTLPKPEPSLLMGVHCLPPPVSLSAPNSPHYGCCESSCSGPHSYSNTPETWLPKNPFHYSSLPFETPHYIILINHQLTSLYVFIQKLCSWGRGSSLPVCWFSFALCSKGAPELQHHLSLEYSTGEGGGDQGPVLYLNWLDFTFRLW